MTAIFEQLFNAWCPSYYPDLLPEHLRDVPIQGYGQYAFEAGFRLALNLTVRSLDLDMLSKME